ncbi:MAG: N-acetyltransferase [Cyclobacteriaceae bacterium]
MDIYIREEQSEDYGAIHAVNEIAFGRENEAKLVDALRRNASAFVPQLSLVATLDNKIVGHILLTRVKIEYDHQLVYDSLALAPMGVIPAAQGKGIGSQLVRAGLDKARELNFKSVIVLGHPRYYPRFGFIPTSRWNIKPPFDVPEEAFMGLELVVGGLERVQGTVRYPDEFDRV